MKKVVFSLLLSAAVVAFSAFSWASDDAEKVNWMTFEEAVAANAESPRKIVIDVYTDWCGWCKRMDASTFSDPLVAKYINANFYAVKLNAEQRENIRYKGNEMKFMPDAGRRGTHELAISLLDGRMGYPSLVYLDENEDRITISPGFKPADKMLTELTFINDEVYKTNTSFEQFSQQRGQ